MQETTDLKKIITDWVRRDNEIRELQKALNLRKLDKKKMSTDLINMMSLRNIDCVDISNGQISYNKKMVKKPITKKLLIDLLDNYYINDSERASELSKYIMEHRSESVKESITFTGKS